MTNNSAPFKFGKAREWHQAQRKLDYKHRTKDGKRIALRDMDISHLSACISRIARLSTEGCTRYTYEVNDSNHVGTGAYIPDREMKGLEVLNYYGYDKYVTAYNYRVNEEAQS